MPKNSGAPNFDDINLELIFLANCLTLKSIKNVYPKFMAIDCAQRK